MKVYIVVESWDNCEAYEDHVHKDRVFAVASTRKIANRLISKRRGALIRMAEMENKKRNEGEPIRIRQYEDGDVTFIDDEQYSIFHTYSFGHDCFEWSIQEMDVMTD